MVLSPAVEWSGLATRPGEAVPGRRTLLSSGDRWDAIQVDLVHVTGPSEIPETSLPSHILLRDLAATAGMSTFQLVRRFKDATGLPPHRFVTRRRIERAKQLLSDPDSSVLEVALACGFASPSHFAQAFRMVTGVTPRSYRSTSGS